MTDSTQRAGNRAADVSIDMDNRLKKASSARVPSVERVDFSIPERFRQSVLAHPDRLAFQVSDCSMSYKQLDCFSNRLANQILSVTQPVPEAVCLLFEHTDKVPAAILGVLKSGKFYVVLEVSNPDHRNNSLIKDSRAGLILASNRTIEVARRIATRKNMIINIDAVDDSISDSAPEVEISPSDVAYVVYTSGSTGEPKGAIWTHEGALHKELRQANGWETKPDDRIALVFSYGVGPAADNLFSAMFNGASIYPFNIKDETARSLLDWLERDKITFLHTVPTYFRLLASQISEEDSFPSLRLIRLTGESIYGHDVELFQAHFAEQCVLHVGFGSTETGALLHDVYEVDSRVPYGIVPLGYATAGMQITVVDEAGAEVEKGQIGQLAITSRYMFSGYWGDRTKTGQALSDNSNENNRSTYLMGDLGRKLEDGRIQHLGRKDAQLKIRGNRVEIGEVESALLKVANVDQVAVIPQITDQGDTRLAAFIVAREAASLSIRDLRLKLKSLLPDFMIPALFLPVDSLPRTLTGKVNRNALAKLTGVASDNGRVPDPRDFIESQLVAVWQQLLNHKFFGIRDDFYDVGGDSLLAMRLSMEIESVFGREINLANFPKLLTIEVLGDAIEAAEQENYDQPILEVQHGETEPPFFFFHGDYLSGGAFCRNLARYMGSEFSFFAIPPHGLDGRALPSTIEAMAVDRAEALLQFRPTGSFRLGGFCWGGIMALETARQLVIRGASVESVMLIDTDPKNVNLRPVRRAIRQAGNWLRISEETQLMFFAEYRHFMDLKKGLGTKPGVWNKIRLSLQKLRNASRRLIAGQSRPTTEDLLVPRDRHARFGTFSRITQNYVAEPYAGRVALMRTQRLRDLYPNDPKRNWLPIAPHIKVIDVEGDHLTCVTKHADDLGRKMAKYLRELSPENESESGSSDSM